MSSVTLVLNINPFTAQACEISGLNDAHMHLQTVYFPVLYFITSFFSAMQLNENPFTHQCGKKESKKALGFQQGFRFHTFIGRFQVTVWQ